ncbi:hypothetical protein MIS46_09940 [Wielerella bovis]|nr:HYD1 signature containing ADP-ribosyltransferase family protein [Wielerella bovis]ULJ63669.1 hypothetical protein MIS46_09940 [Wielerella bovis]
MRHYTNSLGIREIQSTTPNVIKAWDQNKVFAVPAKGKISARDFEARYALKPGKAGKFVEFDTCPGEFTPRPFAKNPKFKEWTYDGDLILNDWRKATFHINN